MPTGATAGGPTAPSSAEIVAFDPLTGMFTLHGPVSAESSGAHFYSELAGEKPSAQGVAILRGADRFAEDAYTVAARLAARRYREPLAMRRAPLMPPTSRNMRSAFLAAISLLLSPS